MEFLQLIPNSPYGLDIIWRYRNKEGTISIDRISLYLATSENPRGRNLFHQALF